MGVYVEELQDQRVGLVCKLPDNAIKALHRGAQCSLFVGVVMSETLPILCFAFRVHDEPEHPLTVFHLDTFPETVPLLTKMLMSGMATLHCINELNHPMLSAACEFPSEVGRAAAAAYSDCQPWLLTPGSANSLKPEDCHRIFELAIDRFSRHVYASPNRAQSEHVIMAAMLDLTLVVWEPTEVFEVTPTTQDGPFLIGDTDEGVKFERLLHLTIDCVYRGHTYRSPSVQDGKNMRELTDVLAFDENSICVIQAKALSVLNVNDQRSSTRRAANVTKDIRKGLSQLGGTLGNIRSGTRIISSDGAPLEVPSREELPAHGIVVVSEMYPFVDWKQVAAAVVKASESERHKAMFHVMDMRELAALTTRCPDGSVFFNRLCQRWLNVRRRGTGYIRSIVPTD